MRRISKLYLAIVLLPFLASCGNGEQKTNASLVDSTATKECYIAIDGKDTAHLDLRISDNGNINGDLVINYAEKASNTGTVAGKFNNDTLFVDYTFHQSTSKDQTYKNPLAFLKKDNKLALGVGVIETSMGRSYFAKDKPINFEQIKFIFETTPCKN